MALVTPPNASQAFVQQGTAESFTLTSVAFRFLTNIVNSLNGTVASGVSQVVLGNGMTISSGLGIPNGRVSGSIGDLYTNTSGGAGVTLWVKESQSGTSSGWVSK